MGAGASIEGREEAIAQIKGADMDFPKHGIRLSYYTQFIEENGGRSAFEGLTTTQVCEQMVKPATSSIQSSYCNLLRLQESRAVGIASVFISHAWAYLFLDVCEALLYHFKDDLSVIVWFDLFAVNQHTTSTKPFEWWTTTFQYAIRDFGRTVMVFAPWQDPIPLRRAWCLWELYCTVKMECMFEVAMSQTEQQRFFSDISINSELNLKKMLANIDVENSQSFNPSDREKIFDIVKTTIGFAALNSLVFERLRTWTTSTTTDILNNSKLSIRESLLMKRTLGELYLQQGNYFTAEEYFTGLIDEFKEEFGSTHEETLKLIYSFATLMLIIRKFDISEPLLQEVIDKSIEISVNTNDILALRATQKLGLLCERSDRFSEARDYYERAHRAMEATIGEKDPNTISALNDLSAFLDVQGEKEEAEKLYMKSFTICKEILGEKHPDTLNVYYNLGCLYSDVGKTKEALEIFEETYRLRAISLGETHLNTLDNMETLALLYDYTDDFQKAYDMFLKRLHLYESFFGPKVPTTLTQISSFGSWLLSDKNMPEKAEPFLRKAFEYYYETLGAVDERTPLAFDNYRYCLERNEKTKELQDLIEQYPDLSTAG